MKLEIENSGQRREITGWRKWAVGIPLIVVATLIAAAVVLFAFGVTLTLGVILAVTTPVAMAVVFLWILAGGKPHR